MAILIIKLKRPKVKILKGKVIKFKIGLIKELIKPKPNPEISKICQGAVNSIPKRLVWPGTIFKLTPGTNLVTKKSPTIPAVI